MSEQTRERQREGEGAWVEEVEQASKRGRELRWGRLTKAIREGKTRAAFPSPPSVHLVRLAWICVAKACVEPPGISGSTVDFCREPESSPPPPAPPPSSGTSYLVRMPSVSLSLPSALAGRARTWVCLSCMFWVRKLQTGMNAGLSDQLKVIMDKKKKCSAALFDAVLQVYVSRLYF